MNTPQVKPLDAAVTVLALGLLLGLIARLMENARPLASLFGF